MFAIAKTNSVNDHLKLEKILKQLENAYSDRWFTITNVDVDAKLVGKIEEV